MDSTLKFPFYAKFAFIIIGAFALVFAIYIGQQILLPIIYSIILAILLSPLVNYLEKRKINRAFAITIVLSTCIILIALLIALLSSQASRLVDAWPQLTAKFEQLLNQTILWFSQTFNIHPTKINEWLLNQKAEFISNSGTSIGNTLSTMGGMLAAIVLTPVYIFMFLYYQNHLVLFIHKLFGASNNNEVGEVLTETKTIVQSYLVGLFFEMIIIAILNSAGLLALGIDYAILLGIAGALLNVLPYIGGLIAMAIYAVIALITKSPVYAIYVIGLYNVIQFIDNNLIVPKIVGSKVKLNAFISLITVILGAALCGVPGMFLAIPITAILKVIFDRIEPLKPWGFLFGNIVPTTPKLKLVFTKKSAPKIKS